MRKLFGTDGVRGVANVYPMTAEMAIQLGRAIAYVFKKEPHRHKIVIGKDTRLSGYMLENAMVAGICSMGVDVMLVGPLPTPGIAFITSSMRADAGVVISASHNPYQDNGIKFFSRDGFKLPDRLEAEIEDFIFNKGEQSYRPTASDIGKAYRIDDAIGRYVVFSKNTFPKELTLSGLKIAVDCAHGATYKVAPEVFYELGAEVFPIGVEPDGENINYKCGSLYPEVVAKLVKEKKADIGISLDGDGDRVILVDEKGQVLDGDYLMAIVATRMLKQNALKKKTLVTTIMSNMGLEDAIKRVGGKIIRTKVGDRYVVDEMLKGGYNLGGEQSGHIVFMEHTTTGDGIISALQVLAIMVKEGKRLSELSTVMQTYPQILMNIKVKEKKEFTAVPQVAKRIREVEKKLNGSGRLSVRYSGTEPLARVMIEGKNGKEIKKMAKYIAEAIEKELG
ncbi:MAG: phosphoglucosamine mutase [Deltaproteobacteria bacterium GWC2_42_51]|nr:MAG: phosphoglucosamine mutase [Deltaproteobacteria bacterium GWA2_42_85]OGP25773.1 MAG: phosphoglucosamine mutase [Deltaproteobacteria bacterium GWB2_42_7]OGP35923.1 MAG: phosphoglucosamine mutase [Deltaproteobacteria bacterium GWC2_42_51]OGP46809.1 MAG: phosphoglucosamine mutase [Deltaproteobacteria bacterium GWF2_42_12]OGQ23810.1 MAG: phosphoglucosamine mutase [Deltaproteobacteria bacterium RIFCSPHIGHO2_02_FULL_42_44]OGQ35782.1 MAG: phosphoglucosamine mutase [Deltaproteobacteria bacteriu